MENTSNWFERIVNISNKWANWIACIAIISMVSSICFDVIFRATNHSIKGSYDTVCLLNVVLVALSMGYTQIKKRHTTVSLASRLPQRAQYVIASITTIVSICLLVLVTYATIIFAKQSWLNRDVTMTLEIPLYPIMLVLVIGCVLICLALAVDFIRSINKAVRG